MEFNGKLVRSIRKLAKAGNTLSDIASELISTMQMTDDEAWDAIEFALN